MANKTKTIRIESILGGHSPTTHLAAPDQFRASFGIDPSLPVDNGDGIYSSIASGLIRPVGVTNGGNSLAGMPMWIVPNPKNEINSTVRSHYIYDSAGSVYATDFGLSNFVSLGDLNDGGSASGNGASYYDNYIYFARDTTIARYGPLNGTPTFVDDFWVGTLGKAALSNKNYPGDPWVGFVYPNHVLHRHSDGRLYIADVVDNQGTIHYIKTSKTTVEGDTDNGSTYDAINLGYGLWPIDIESYGDLIVIGLLEVDERTGGAHSLAVRSKVAFWDTTSDNVNSITWVEFPGSCLTAIVNAGGTLYFFDGSTDDFGVRVTRYLGGNTFEEVAYNEMGYSPSAGAVGGRAEQLVFGSANTVPDYFTYGGVGCVWSLNLRNKLSRGLFNIARTPTANTTGVTALSFTEALNFNQQGIIFGHDGNRIATTFQALLDSTSQPIWWSQTYRIGQRFKVTKIKIPTTKSSSVPTKQIVPTLYFDDSATTKVLMTLDYDTTRPSKTFVIRPENAVGENNFWLELRWTGTGTWTVGLPITIEYELIDD